MLSPRLLFAAEIVALVAVAANHPIHAKADDEAPAVVTDGDASRIDEIPKHFILNPDDDRPASYPAAISLEKLEGFLKTQELTGQGCGGMIWEGGACGMFCNIYAAAKTPWLKDEVEFDAIYAQTKTGNFLASFTLGRNRYGRADRKSDKFTWETNYEPQYEKQAIHQVLFGKDSAQRKTLLTKISDSFKDLDLAQFPAKSRESLALQLKPCEDDPDSAVQMLAKKLRTSLTSSDSRP